MFQKSLLGLSALTVITACDKNRQNNLKLIEKPNIIFILADDLGYGDLGCYGQKVIKTPVLDKLAGEGIRFTRHYSGSTVSAPSRCCLMTGKHTGHARVRGNANVPLMESDTTVAELLKGAGYRTALIGKWGLGESGTSGIPNKKGFDYFYGYLNQTHAHNSYPHMLWRDTTMIMLSNKVMLETEGYAKGNGGVATEKNEFSNALFTAEALQYLEQNAGNPFFIYLSYTIPHANNEAPKYDSIGVEVPGIGEYSNKPWPAVEKAKAAAISYLDSDIGKIVVLLKEKGLDNNTIIIFSSDNGPHQEGGVIAEFLNSNGSLQGIKRDLFEGGIRVPLIVWAPSIIKGNRISDHVSAFWDFLPTACDIAGIQKPAWTDGISMLPELLGKDQLKHESLYWEFFEQGGKQAVICGNWKGIRWGAHKDSGAMIQVFDLANDISEQNPLTAVYPDKANSYSKIMAKEHILSENFKFDYEIKKE